MKRKAIISTLIIILIVILLPLSPYKNGLYNVNILSLFISHIYPNFLTEITSVFFNIVLFGGINILLSKYINRRNVGD